MLLNALNYVSFKNAIIYLFNKYFGCCLGPRSVLDTRATIVYKRGKSTIFMEITFWPWKLGNSHISKQANNHAVISDVAFSKKK